jgi:hypothetical protein
VNSTKPTAEEHLVDDFLAQPLKCFHTPHQIMQRSSKSGRSLQSYASRRRGEKPQSPPADTVLSFVVRKSTLRNRSTIHPSH